MLILQRVRFPLRLVLAAVALAGAAASSSANPDEAPFLAENAAAMTKMMAAMNIKPSGDVDRDFVAMMAAHHQGAIDMAEAQLRYGRNERLRRLAHEIIITQQEEIRAMWLAIGQRPQPLDASTAPPPADARNAPVHHQQDMHSVR